MNWISFKGLRSDELGLIVSKMPGFPTAKRKYSQEPVPGNGVLLLDEGYYEPITVNVSFNLFNSATSINVINSWLSGTGDLIISDDENYRYKAVAFDGVTCKRDRVGSSKYDVITVKFICEPFRYEAVPDVLTLPGATTIGGAGTVDAEPEIVVDGTGDCTLTVGSTVLTLTGLTGSITIDCARKIAYSGGTSLSHLVEGEWPKLSVNGTAVSWTGNVTSVTVTPNWRWL